MKWIISSITYQSGIRKKKEKAMQCTESSSSSFSLVEFKVKVKKYEKIDENKNQENRTWLLSEDLEYKRIPLHSGYKDLQRNRENNITIWSKNI